MMNIRNDQALQMTKQDHGFVPSATAQIIHRRRDVVLANPGGEA
jgi:hypothetical protein